MTNVYLSEIRAAKPLSSANYNMSVKTAYLTGGASGIGRAVTERLVSKGVKVAIADIDLDGAKAVAGKLNAQIDVELVFPYHVDVCSWESQRQAFTKAVEDLGRIDLVFPIAGIGENKSWVPNDTNSNEFIEPDLNIIAVNLHGLLYTCSLAIQQMRRQDQDDHGFRGKSMSTTEPEKLSRASTVQV